ncbi:type I-E CRISPR-associated protein Cas6/Cse3/CasE [Streptomyces chrestomyceticus]|uniref:type I-E CRISPR-associated protein Cas6/Cse3/CasE n=1 Tax=Streptomyces chrestomyceticus TaxID=68185 RepID=UPI0004C8FD8B
MTTTLAPPATAHLTKIQINPRSDDAGPDLTNAQRLHHRVLSLTPDPPGTGTRRAAGVLYRLERDRTKHTLLIQSTAPLDLTHLPADYATATDHRDITPLLTWCQQGRAIRYRLDAAPQRSRPSTTTDAKGRRHRGKLFPLYGEEATAWWHRKATEAGLTLDPHTLLTASQPAIFGRKKHPHEPGRMRFHMPITRFEGHAIITDPDALRAAITTGVGRARAYGAGLLSIAPSR